MTQGKKIGLKVRRVGRPKKTVELKTVTKPKKEKGIKKEQIIEKQPAIKKEKEKTPKKLHLGTFNTEDLVEELIMNNKIHKEAELKRRKIMWASVSFLMILIVVFWGYGLQRSFAKNKINSEDESSLISDWEEVTDGIAEQLREIKQGIEQIDSFAQESDNVVASTTSVGFPEEQIIEEQTVSTSSEELKN